MSETVKQSLLFEPSSPSAIQRLVREVQGSGPMFTTAYNRTYNRHNR
jgi:hypothetical protein